MLEIPFCLDDLTALLAAAGDEASFAPIAAHHLARLDDLRRRLGDFVDHSAQDRRHLLTDEERAAADEAARLLGGGLSVGSPDRRGDSPGRTPS